MKNFSVQVFLLAFSFFTCLSCDSSELLEPCETQKFGTIIISNNGSNPYNVYVDNQFIIQLGSGQISTEIELQEGNNRELYAEQVTGYILFPTTRTTSLNVVRCSNYSWQIP